MNYSPELRRYIVKEIQRQLNIITSGQAGSNTMDTEDIDNIMPGIPTIPGRPVMHPFGVASRAPRGTIAVTAQQGSHPGNKLTLGHRYASQPAVEEGESCLYNHFGQRVYLQNGSIRIGSQVAANPLVLGTELKDLLQQLLQLLSTHTHVGNLGSPTSAPIEAAQFTQFKTDFVDNDTIFSETNFTEKGGA